MHKLKCNKTGHKTHSILGTNYYMLDHILSVTDVCIHNQQIETTANVLTEEAHYCMLLLLQP